MNKDKFLFTAKFSWSMNAQELLSNWIPELTETLDELFRYVFTTSDYQFNYDGLYEGDEVDSQAIKEILHLYILRIFGVD